jgi:regulator of protease activity HflC (stomatin/prohibitin superfamily)
MAPPSYQQDLEAGCCVVKVANQNKECVAGCGGCLGLALTLFLIVLLSSIKVVEVNQQLVFSNSEGKWVRNGPFTAVVWPHQRMARREATRLGSREYVVLKNERTGEKRHVSGPGLIFPGPYDSIEETRPKVMLQKNEYTRLVDTLSGFERVVRGPQTLVPAPLEEAPKGKELAIVVGATNAVLVLNKTTGVKSLVTKQGMFTPGPYEAVLRVQEAKLVEPHEYAVVKDHLSGSSRNELGPQLLQVGAYEELLEVASKVMLQKDEYLRLLDERTGAERVLTGPQTVVPEPWENAPDGKQQAAFVTTESAVLVLTRTTGQQRLEKAPGVFIPAPYERVLKVRRKIHVLPHEAVVVRAANGAITVRSGTSSGGSNAFFLEPYTEVVEMNWSSYNRPGAEEPVPRLPVTNIDLRSQKMFFNYEVRTGDNVKLRLEGTIFWQVKDVAALISMTSDPSGDVSQHARSALIQGVSKVPLSRFMSDFNNITTEAFRTQASDGFYAERGVELQSMELTRFDCVDEETAAVLQQIIQETTNRINELQKADSENEVRSAHLQADIALEKQRTELIRTRAENSRLEAEMAGQADGTKLVKSAATFIDGLNASLPSVDARVELYRLHETTKGRNTDTQNLAAGNAKLFLTPQDLNLKLQMGSESSSS